MGDTRVDELGKGPLADMRLRKIGFVFQAYNLIPVLTARENVEFVMQVQGVSPAERRVKSMVLLEEVGLADWTRPGAADPRRDHGDRALAQSLP